MFAIGAPRWFVCGASDLVPGGVCGYSEHADDGASVSNLNHTDGPLLPNAKFVAECRCGFRVDSAAATAEEAAAELVDRHRCKFPQFTARPIAPKVPDTVELRMARMESLIEMLADTVTKLRAEQLMREAAKDLDA
jgi:hypothetical protein